MHMLLAYEVDAEPQLQACLQEALLTVHKVENAGRVSLLTSARVMWYGGSCNEIVQVASPVLFACLAACVFWAACSCSGVWNSQCG
jgi:hypothetical protein